MGDGRPGPWLRPVSNREHEEVSEYERQYENGQDPKILDIIDIPLLGKKTSNNVYQVENHSLDKDSYWVKRGTVDPSNLKSWADGPATLWANGYSTSNGRNDRVPIDIAATLTGSLYLVEAPSIAAYVFETGAAFGKAKRRVQASFVYNGVTYEMWCTDPVVERTLLAGQNGRTELGSGFITVSLGELFDGYVYKLAATVITQKTLDWRS